VLPVNEFVPLFIGAPYKVQVPEVRLID